MQDSLVQGVRELQVGTRAHANYVKDFERRAALNPKRCAEEALGELSAGQTALTRIFKQVFGEYLKAHPVRDGLVLPDNPELREFFLLWLHWLKFYRISLEFFQRCISVPGGPDVRHAKAMCKCFVKHEISSEFVYLLVAEHVAEQFPHPRRQQVLVEQFTAFFVSHTSLRHNKRLWKAMKELQEPEESTYERLIKEMAGEVWAVWREKQSAARGQWFEPDDLMEMRTEIARRLEGRAAPPQASELASFAVRERLLKHAKNAGLTPREHEVFELFLSNPRMTSREVGSKLNISASTVRTIKSRIKPILRAAR